ncbi:MAG: hypothetical protein AMXMBFR76_00860 [Pseudomonadota bacterium]
MTLPPPEEAAAAGSGKQGFGARLRAGREGRGLTVLEVADALRLSPRMIEAIESEDIGALPPMLFAKGYLRSYAAFVGIDPSAVLQDFEARAATGTALQPPPMRRPIADLNDVKRGRQLASLVLLVLALSALVFWWTRAEDPHLTFPRSAEAPEADSERSSGEPDESILGAEPSTPAGEAAAVGPSSGVVTEALVPGAAPATSGSAAQGPGPDGPSSEPPAPISVPQEPVAPVPPVAPSSVGQVPATDAAMARLKIRYDEDCWTEVRDERGRQLIYRLAKAGTEQEVTGTPPFSLYLGYAPGVSVEIDGRPVDLASRIGNSTVARIKLDRPQE